MVDMKRRQTRIRAVSPKILQIFFYRHNSLYLICFVFFNQAQTKAKPTHKKGKVSILNV